MFKKEIITKSEYYIPASTIFLGVTVLYAYNFFKHTEETYLLDTLIYWSIYLVISLFLQYVVYFNAKKILAKKKRHR
jgi:hypothetical protein